MFNHKADESVTCDNCCDNCCDNKQDHHYCIFVFLHIYFYLMFPYAA